MQSGPGANAWRLPTLIRGRDGIWGAHAPSRAIAAPRRDALGGEKSAMARAPSGGTNGVKSKFFNRSVRAAALACGRKTKAAGTAAATGFGTRSERANVK